MRAGYEFGDKTVALAAFAHEPTDARSSCIAVVQATSNDHVSEVAACRDLGAPIVIVVTLTTVEQWRQKEGTAELVDSGAIETAEAFFQGKASQFAPDAVFRAKNWGRVDRDFQLSFVDVGLMPVVEARIGEQLKGLIERVVQGLRQALWPRLANVSIDDGHWLLKSSFWLLAAKILRDKKVPGFSSLDLLDVDSVFAQVARHYDSARASANQIPITSRQQREALKHAAAEIARFSHLGHVTTESLAYVYESVLITKETRAALGTHSTPQYLVDYVVGKLASWIERIPSDDRDVFEPACGHAAFLVASMRLLKELAAAEGQADCRRYLRERLHGVEIDPFALEIARLSLTIADIPNPNGWDLACQDMFADSILATKAQKATVLLGNPPFERFSEEDRKGYSESEIQLRYQNKTAEVLGRVLPELRIGGVFGFVVPQGILHEKNATELRRLICRDFEIQEVCLFPDKVFSFSDAESAILLGRRVTSPLARHQMSCRRVREPEMDRFRLDYCVSSEHDLPQATMCSSDTCDLRFPDLPEIWRVLTDAARLSDLARMGQGLFYKANDKLQPGQKTIEKHRFPGAKRGFPNVDRGLLLHKLPRAAWMSLDPKVLDREVTGANPSPQVLLNYARVSRGPWRLKALIDRKGHPVTSRFITVRSVDAGIPLEYLWGLLNSPLANAYAFSHLAKRDNPVGTMRKLPVPAASNEDFQRVAILVRDYWNAVTNQGVLSGTVCDDNLARRCLLAVDAEVLRLYDLPPKLERQVLDLFAGHQRAGVPFPFDRYYPQDFEPWLHLHEYLSEAFQGSTARAMLKSHRTFASPDVTEAFRRATEDFEE